MPALRIPGLPDFTEDPLNPYSVEDIAGWWDTAAVQSTLVANGGGQGMVAAGPWGYVEKYLNLQGTILLPAVDQDAVRRALLVNLPPGKDVALGYLGEGWETDKQVYVRCYDKATFQREWNHMVFQIPLVQTDPFKYGLEPLTSGLGIFTGETYYRTYDNPSGANWSRAYDNPSGSVWSRGYEYAADTAGLPIVATLDADADVASQRVTVEVVGPIADGWYITNDATGERLYAKVSIPDQGSAVFDCKNRTAYLNGVDITSRTFGDWLTLVPGRNSFRLFSGLITAGYARITALPAYL